MNDNNTKDVDKWSRDLKEFKELMDVYAINVVKIDCALPRTQHCKLVAVVDGGKE